MSLSLFRASSQCAHFDLAATPGVPLVLGFKLKLTSIVDDHGVVGVYHAAAGYSGYHTRIRNSDDAIQADVAQQPAYDVSNKTGLVTATWQTVIGVWTSVTSRQVFLDDVAGNLSGASIAVTEAVRLTLGAYYASGSLGGYLDGKIAELFQLNAVPSSGERTAFHNGSKPIDIWTSSLVRYWPLKDDVVDDVLGSTFTLVNSPTIDADHPTMIELANVPVLRRGRGR